MSLRRLSPAHRYQEINEPVHPVRRHIHHIAVEDEDAKAAGHTEAPLNAYMVPSQYLPRDVIARVAPKRPLVQTAAAPLAKEPVKFYAQTAAMPEPLRIRRPRRQAAVAAEDEVEQVAQPRKNILLVGLDWLAVKLVAAKDGLSRIFRRRRPVHYSAVAGTSHKYAVLADNRFKFGAAVMIFLLLLSFGLFGGLINDTAKSPTPGDIGTNGGNSGLEVTDRPGSGGSGSANSPQPTATPQSAPNTAGTALQPSQSFSAPGPSPVPVGGRGGGPDPMAGTPTVGTGSNTIPEALPTPPATDPLLNNTPSTPLPVTVTVPPTNVSEGGKTIVDTSGTTVTIN